MSFPQLVSEELKRARVKFPHKESSGHEAYAVILEELDEFWDEVKKQNPDRIAMLKELVQTAAMRQRAAEDLNLIE